MNSAENSQEISNSLFNKSTHLEFPRAYGMWFHKNVSSFPGGVFMLHLSAKQQEFLLWIKNSMYDKHSRRTPCLTHFVSFFRRKTQNYYDKITVC